MARQYAVPGLGPAVLVNETRSGTEALAGSSTFINELAAPITVAPASGAIVFTGFAPTGNANAAPAVGSIVFGGFAPALSSTAAPAVGSVVFTGFAPGGSVVTAAPATGAVRFTGFAPNAGQNVQPQVGNITYTGFAPGIVNQLTSGFFRPVF